MQKRHRILRKDANEMGIHVENPFEDLEAKRLALRDIMGWRSLGRTPLADAPDYAIGNAYLKAYQKGE